MLQYFTKSINRLVMGSFVFVLLLPLGFIISTLSQHSWDSAQKEIQEKHLLLAKSLEQPVQMYFDAIEHDLDIFVKATQFSLRNDSSKKALMNQFVNTEQNLVALSFLPIDQTGNTIISIHKDYLIKANANIDGFSYHLTELKYRKYDMENSVSSVIRSPVSNNPVVLLKYHVIGKDRNKQGTIFVEIDLAAIRAICAKIRFGERGHCAIVDQLGQVVAHPNKEYESEIKNLSAIDIVDKMKNEGSGIWTFYSPNVKEEVVAGFNTMRDLGWGIMVPQPKSELESPFKSVIHTVITWLIVGIIISLLVAYILTQQITKPLNSLVVKSKEIGIRSDTFNLGKIPKNSPAEVSVLWKALSALVDRLHKSNREVRKLNYSLKKDIEKATAKLRATNQYLYKISSNDHLTKIANRRYFEDTVNKILTKKSNNTVGIIVIDVDKFKFINDEYGHEAGDLALKHIASIMKKSTRKNDLPARLGGDEFVVYINNCPDKILYNIAENLRKRVQETPIVWQGISIPLSLSVGIVNARSGQARSLDQLLKFADEAMYESKQAGRNHVSVYTFSGRSKGLVNTAAMKKLQAKAAKTRKTRIKLVKNDVAEIEALLNEIPERPDQITEESLKEPKKQKTSDEDSYWVNVD